MPALYVIGYREDMCRSVYICNPTSEAIVVNLIWSLRFGGCRVLAKFME